MDWDLLKSFEAVAEAGTLSGAARKLKSSPATVGRHIAALEAELKVTLFDRLPEGYAITAAGQEFLPLAHEMSAVAARVVRKGAALEGAGPGVVRIAAGNWFSRLFLQNLAGAVEKMPDVELEIINTYRFADLARRDADIAVRNRRPERGRMVIRSLPEVPSAVYGHADYIARNPAACTDARYRGCRWVGFDREAGHLPSARWLEERRGKPPEVRCLQAINILDGVLGGGGLAVLPCFVGDGEAALERLSPPVVIPESQPWLVIHEDLRRVPAIRAAADWILDLVKDTARSARAA